MSMIEIKEKLGNEREARSLAAGKGQNYPEILVFSGPKKPQYAFNDRTRLLEPTEGSGRQSDTARETQKKGSQGTVEQITMHQKGNRMVVAMEQEEPEGCASCGQKGVKTFQYQMCRPCLAKKLRGIQDFIDEQRKEIFGDR